MNLPRSGPLEETVVPFTATDGMQLNLVHVRGPSPPTREPVLLVHGAGVRAHLFRPPVKTSLVDALVAHGYDVWLENWRASIDVAPNLWTLDQAAVHDHPQAVRKIVEETGHDRIKAVIHCQGSTSFTMSAMAGLVPQVDTIVSNAVSLHPVVPRWSRFKLNYVVPLANAMMPYLNPHWGIEAPTPQAKLISLMVRLSHHECDNMVCKLVSFTYGSGRPALWLHENLDDETHCWIQGEFGCVPLRFFQQMARCVRQGVLLSWEPHDELPTDFAKQEPRTTARFAFLAGMENRCFLPESQVRSHEFVSTFRRNYHTLHLLPDYGHLDVLIGKSAAENIFPLIIQELDRVS